MTATQHETRQSVLAESVREIRRLRAELAAVQRSRTEPIAIVGMACRMPGGAHDPGQFWELLERGGDGITDIPGSRWDVERFYDPSPDAPGKTYTRRGGFLPDIDQFDAAFFGISPREAASLDPQQRLLLEVAWEALEDAGQSPDELAGTSAGVFFGVTGYDYCQRMMQQVDPTDLEPYSLTSNASTFAAGRLSYWLGLSGPSMSVDTACSSSLVGLHLACQSLRAGESSLALAGGVNVLLSPEWYVVLSRARMLAPDGRCKTFDASADGYVRSEGCGIVVLRRLDDALRHGDRILALIRGSAVNQDGRSSGITVPNAAAQQDVVRRALRAAAVAPADVGYVEAHGTGTPLGDPIELRALAAVLGDRPDPLLVGSVKTNIGHLEPAAGIAGLLKVVLALQHERIPPHLHLTTVNPELSLDELGVEIPTSARPWPRGETARLAGVSSFGASGTNAHVVVEEAPPPSTVTGDAALRQGHLLTLSAKSAPALTALAGRYEQRLRHVTERELADICFTAAVGRAHFPHRLAVLACSSEQMCARLAAVAAGDPVPSGVWRGHPQAGTRPGVAFLFTGQGAQYADMARGLYEGEPVFRATLDRCAEVLADLLERPLLSVLFPGAEDAGLIHETQYTQPALFAVEYSLTELWRSWGIEPGAVLGHSVGEMVAACAAGGLSMRDGLRLSALRGRLMQDLGEDGSMASIFASPEVVQQALQPVAATVSIAAVNGPESVVVSGATPALDSLLATLSAQGVRSKPIAVHRAFHSPQIEPMLDAFEQAAADVEFSAPRIPLVSNVTGTVLTGQNGLTARYLREHARAPVQFLAGMNTLFDQGWRTFVEVGPAPTLLGLAGRFAPADANGKPTFLASLRPRQQDHTVLLGSLGALYARGCDVDWTRFYAGFAGRRVALPGYPFQRSHHWFQPSARPAPAPAAAPRPLLGRRVASPLETIQFESQLSADRHPCLADCVIDGLPVVNIGFYLEAVFAAARELHGPGPVDVEDCVVRQSLVLDPDQTTDVVLVLEPRGEDRARYGYYAAHATEDNGTRWVLHAQGAVRPAAGADPPCSADLDAVRERCDEQLPGSEFYRGMWRRRLYVGPAAQWVEHVWRGAGEALGRMRTPQPAEAEDYLLPPGLTDAMFQLLFACLPAESAADSGFMLVAIDRFTFRGYDPTQPLFCHAVLAPTTDTATTLSAEVRLYDGSGRPVAEAGGAHLRRADRAVLRRVAEETRQASAPVAPPQRTAVPAATAGATAGPEEVPELLRRTVARALGVAPADLDVHEPLQNCGLDSLMALEIKDSLSAELGVALPLVVFLEGHSVDKLCTVVLAALGMPADTGTDGPAATGTDQDGPSRPTLVTEPRARYEPFALTDLQQAYLVGRTTAFELGNVSTYFFLEVDLEDVDLDRLTAAWRQLITRHDMLRAVVSPEGYQRVLPEVTAYEIRTADLRDCTVQERERRLRSVHDEMSAQVFDTTVWPLFDIRASRTDDRWTRLHIGLDALVIDAWSTSLLFREWAAVYRGEATSLPELSLTYRDYVVAIRALDGSEEHRRAQEYWRGRIPTLPPAPELPLARDPATVTRPAFSHRSARLSEQEWERFKRAATTAGVTPSAALCTAYSEVLAAWSKSSRFTLTVLFFNRLPLHPQVANIVGNFSATTLLEVHSTATEGFSVRAERIQKQLWTDLDHSQVSGVEVLRDLNRARGSTGRASMPVVFASTVNFAAQDDSAAGTGVAAHLTGMCGSGREVSSSIRTPQVWLDHQVVEEAGALKVNWDVLEELFPAGMVDAMFTAYLGRLHDLCDDERAWTRPAPVLVPAADLDVRRAVNTTSAPLPEGLLHAGFVRTAATDPERIAVIGVDRTLTYRELDERSNQLDRWLRGRAAGPGALVGVVMEKGWEQIAAALGVLKSGAAYVPIDADVPAQRLRLLCANAGISVVLTQTSVDERTGWPDAVVVLAVDGPALDAESTDPLHASGATPDDLAYVIYTSGSTGTPKGVMIEHAAALNTIADINDRFAVTADDRVLALSAMNFDLSVYDVFGLLSVGGAVVLPEPAAHREPERWAALVTAHHVTLWNSVPTLMEMFTEHVLAQQDPTSFPIRLVMMSGDWIPVSLPDRIRAFLPQAVICSLGGATEASIWSILHPIERVEPGTVSIPYGRPMRNQQFHVLNEAMQPCPVWVPGHLYIAGAGLARGYLGDESKTRATFPCHPATGHRLYRTGDLGRYLPDGNIEFLGREDFQVKIQGHRVELGEVEASLLQCRGVRAAVASAVGARQGARRLVAHVVLDSSAGSRDVQAELLGDLRQRLPEYLVPQRVMVVETLPLSDNGKVDRSALHAGDVPLDGAGAAGEGPATRPRDDVERALARIWEGFFGPPEPGVHTSFFDLGGNSLLAVRLVARIRRRFGCSLPLSTLFAHPTIGHLAAVLRDAASPTQRRALVPIRSEGTRPPVVFVHPIGGDVLCYADLAAALGDEQPIYGLQVPDTDPPLTTIPALASHYVEDLTAAVPDGPYRLGGWSMGGCIALEMAQQLCRAGKAVDLLVLVDITEPPGARNGHVVDDAVLLSWFARDLAGLTGAEWELSPEVLRAGPRSPLQILYDEARRGGVLPDDVDPDTFNGIVERFSRNCHALLGYEPQAYSGRVLFIRATDGAPPDTANTWMHLFADDAELLEVTGDHYTVLRPPHLNDVAAAVHAAVNRGTNEKNRSSSDRITVERDGDYG